MPIITLTYTRGNNKRELPIATSKSYKIISAHIEASSIEGLKKAIDEMSIYLLFVFGSGKPSFRTLTYPLNRYIFLVTETSFDIQINESFEIDERCSRAEISIIPDILEPVEEIILTLEYY